MRVRQLCIRTWFVERKIILEYIREHWIEILAIALITTGLILIGPVIASGVLGAIGFGAAGPVAGSLPSF